MIAACILSRSFLFLVKNVKFGLYRRPDLVRLRDFFHDSWTKLKLWTIPFREWLLCTKVYVSHRELSHILDMSISYHICHGNLSCQWVAPFFTIQVVSTDNKATEMSASCKVCYFVFYAVYHFVLHICMSTDIARLINIAIIICQMLCLLTGNVLTSSPKWESCLHKLLRRLRVSLW